MTRRAKLELELNRPTEITLLYDEPITGASQYGNYNLYAVKSDDGNEYSFFAPDEVHEKLKELSKGDTAIVTKKAEERNGKYYSTYEVLIPQMQQRYANEPRSLDDILGETSIDEEVPAREEDELYGVMLRSLTDAVKIAGELGGVVDVNRIGITLFIARSKNLNGYGYGG
jgi:hypothetical protein